MPITRDFPADDYTAFIGSTTPLHMPAVCAPRVQCGFQPQPVTLAAVFRNVQAFAFREPVNYDTFDRAVQSNR